jgi:dTDP-4-amino-4,6-dideoxygalactose transaminase
MIPKHRPPFGILTVIRSIFSNPYENSIEKLENIYAKTCGVNQAIWLPSARAGICWALKAVIKKGDNVVGPAYTCYSVHEAMFRSGGKVHLVDTEKNGLLMDDVSLKANQVRSYTLVLSEICGYNYDFSKIRKDVITDPKICIIDMAQAVPIPKLFKRIKNNDFAVISFGAGKPMYSGWGGMGFTNDLLLANKVRKIRDSYLIKSNLFTFIKRALYVICRTLGKGRVVYLFYAKIMCIGKCIYQMKKTKKDIFTPIKSLYSVWRHKKLSKKWFLSSTSIDRYLILYNLRNVNKYSEHRMALASCYYNNLKGTAGLIVPKPSLNAMHSYTIRINSAVRKTFCKYLWKEGIDVDMLWVGSYHYIDRDKYPNTSRIKSEILNLPLDLNLDSNDIYKISKKIIYCATKAYKENKTSIQFGC